MIETIYKYESFTYDIMDCFANQELVEAIHYLRAKREYIDSLEEGSAEKSNGIYFNDWHTSLVLGEMRLRVSEEMAGTVGYTGCIEEFSEFI